MEIMIGDFKFSVLENGSNLTPQNCTFRVLSSDPTSVDSLFRGEESFMMRHSEDEEWVTVANEYDVSYVELRHDIDIGWVDGEMKRADVTTVYMVRKGG